MELSEGAVPSHSQGSWASGSGSTRAGSSSCSSTSGCCRSGYKDVFGPGQDNKAFALATVSALLFFASVVLHELGHAVVARRNGIGITSISLWMFGGLADMREEPRTPGAEFSDARRPGRP